MNQEKIVFKKNEGNKFSQKLPGVNVDCKTYQEICKIAQFTNATQSEVIRVLIVEALKYVSLEDGE